MIGPVLIQFGTEEQKKRFLPRAANLDDWWCQGFSEPGAGSDLASLKTAAKRDGDHYVVNGQKIWTSTAHHADWCFVLVRTNPNAAKRQEGISFLLVDMKTPGITVRPIISIDGSHHLNEVFFDDVRVPVENRVYEENRGWDVAKFLLGNERTGIARLGKSKERVKAAKEMARKVRENGRPLIEDAAFRQRVAQFEVDMKALEITQYRVVSAYDKAARRTARSAVVGAEGEGHRAAAGDDGTGDGCRRPDVDADLGGGTGGAVERAGCRAGVGDAVHRQLSVPARRVDLWRHERDPEEHSDQSGAGALVHDSPCHCEEARRRQVSVSRYSALTAIAPSARAPAMTGMNEDPRWISHSPMNSAC